MANTIQDKLAYLEETKGLIKEAIVAKGVSVSESDTFRSYADKIKTIESGGSIAGAPSGIKFANSTFTTVPVEIFPYLEQQTDLSGIFENCKKLTSVPLFNTSKAIDMRYMFTDCNSLTTVPQFDTSNVTFMNDMFRGCGKLQTVPRFDTSNVIDMRYMFQNCSSLTTVPLFDTSKCTNMSYMFTGCSSLTTVPQFDTSNVIDMYNMFVRCSSLQTVPLLDVSNVTKNDYMLYGCSSLTNLGGLRGLKMNLDLTSSSLLTVESVMNVINAAADMTSSPKTLTLRKNVFNKLSQEQIATATAKGWNIAAS